VLESIRRGLRAQEGMTLLELMIAIALLGIVVPILVTTLVSVQTSVGREQDRSLTNDQARLAIEELDKEIRSGNLLYDPKDETPSYMSLRVYTQTNASTRTPGNRCVQWRIVNGELQRRDWSITWRTDGVVSPWRVVADHVVNQTVAPAVPAFQLDPDPSKGYSCVANCGDSAPGNDRYAGRALVVTLVVNQNAESGNDVRIQSTITGRNTQYGYPVSVCDDVPPV
jgi:prepilin-type N-terminal cleavage/methylation domain-containing protein